MVGGRWWWRTKTCRISPSPKRPCVAQHSHNQTSANNWPHFAKVLAVFSTTTPSTTYLVSTIITFTSTTTNFMSGSYSTSPSHLCLISAVLISVLLHFLDPSPPSPVAPFPFDRSPITTCLPWF